MGEYMASIYLDNNSTTPLDPQVLDLMLPYFKDLYGNPNAKHSIGESTHQGLEEASDKIYFSLNMNISDTLIVTSCATESINSIHNSILNEYLKNPNSIKKQIITSPLEHSAVLKSLKHLESFGIEVIKLPIKNQSYTLEDFLEIYDPQKILLVSLGLVNSETGIIHPLESIAKVCKQDKVLTHTDATQAIGKIPVDINQLPVDYISFSAHKFHGPKGIGGLIIKGDAPFTPLLYGGEQMGGLRAGTLNTASIVGMGEAIYKTTKNLSNYTNHVLGLRNILEDYLQSIDNCVIFGKEQSRIPNTTYFTIKDIDLDYFAWYLNQYVCISTGSACSSIMPHQVSNEKNTKARGIRVSLSSLTTTADIEKLIEYINHFLKRS